MKILIARHAEDKGPEYEDEQRILTQKGIKQAKVLSKTIKKFIPTHIYCSTLRRAIDTASIIEKFCDLKVEKQQIFNEQLSGRLGEHKKENKGFVNSNDSFEGGETYIDLKERALKAWTWLLERHQEKSEDRIVLITHGRFMTFLIHIILGVDPNGFNLIIENCSHLIFNISEDWRPQLVLPLSGKGYP